MLVAAVELGDEVSIACRVELGHGGVGEVAAIAGLRFVVHAGEHGTISGRVSGLGRATTLRSPVPALCSLKHKRSSVSHVPRRSSDQKLNDLDVDRPRHVADSDRASDEPRAALSGPESRTKRRASWSRRSTTHRRASRRRGTSPCRGRGRLPAALDVARATAHTESQLSETDNTDLCFLSYKRNLVVVPTDAEITFADHAGRLYARRYGMAPMVGRLLGYLAICDPPEQSITELAEALLASRSAIAGAVSALDNLDLISRTRAAGERMDRVRIDLAGPRSMGFDVTEYREQGDLAAKAWRCWPTNLLNGGRCCWSGLRSPTSWWRDCRTWNRTGKPTARRCALLANSPTSTEDHE